MTKRLTTGVILILTALVLYVPYINRVMFCDEANTLYQYAGDPVRALLAYSTPNNHMLHSALLWLMTNLAGTSQVVVRFVALAGALLAVALMFRVAAKLAGYRAGVAACLFLIANLGFADFAINARGYTLSIAFTLLLIDRVFLASAVHTRRYHYTLMAISFALILLLPSMLMLLVAVGAWIAWEARAKPRYRPLLIAMIAGIATAGIFYAPSYLRGLFGEHLDRFGETDLLVLLRLWLNQTFNTPWIGTLFAAACIVGVIVLLWRAAPIPVGDARLKRGYPRARLIIALILGTTALIAIVQLLALHKLFFARNYIFLLAPVALLGGIGFSRIAGRFTLPLVAALFVISVVPLRALDGSYEEKTVWNLIQQNVGEHDQVLAAPCLNAPMQYHILHSENPDRLFLTPETERVFVLLREDPLREALEIYHMENNVAACTPVTDGSWGAREVYICQPIHTN